MFLLLVSSAVAQPIERSQAVVREFRNANPCPSTGRILGACPGWQADHGIPLCAGGVDRVENLHWLSVDDHRFKTLVDVRECRKLQKWANTPARERLINVEEAQ
ncbi:MAG: HNH endonuclease [Ramlibacter sp.]|nr:HNH endonuclease [Ramlibacter sp.]